MQLHLDSEESRALAWIADRYTSAAVLYDCGTYTYADEDDPSSNNGMDLDVSPTVADRYLVELAEENGVPEQRIPACAGGTLAEKLHRLYDVLTEGRA